MAFPIVDIDKISPQPEEPPKELTSPWAATPWEWAKKETPITEAHAKVVEIAGKGLEYAMLPFTATGIARKELDQPWYLPTYKSLPADWYEPEEVRKRYPGGEKYQEYAKLPWQEQLKYEAPMWGLTAIIPGATQARTALAPTAAAGGIRGGAATVGRAALAPLAGAETVAGAGLKYGVGIPLKYVAVKAPQAAVKKAFDVALNRGLDYWLVKQGIRAEHANKVLAYFLKRNEYKLFNYAKANLQKRIHSKMNQATAEKAAAQAADDTIKQMEPKLLQAVRETKPLELPSGVKPTTKPTIPKAEVGVPKAVTTVAEAVTPKVAPAMLENKLPYLTPDLTKYKAKKQALSVADELAEHLGVTPPKYPVITGDTFSKSLKQRVIDRLGGVLARTYRTERLLLRADSFVENGKMQQAFWQPIEKATNRKISGIYTTTDEFKGFVKQNNIDLAKMVSQKTEIDGITLTSAERIGVYLHSLNADNVVHLVFGNNIPVATIDKIVASLTPEERAIAEYFHTYFKAEGPKVSEIHEQMTGKPMDIVDDYFPIQIQRAAEKIGELEFNQIVIDEKKLRYASKWASSKVRKGFTLPRTGKAMQPIKLDAFNIWSKHLEGVEHYKNFSPVIRDLQWLLTNPKLKRSIVQKQGLPTYQVYDQWLKDVAQTNPLRVSNHAEGMLRQLRVNAVTAVLGLNLTTAMKQFPSFISGMAEIGELPALKGLMTSLRYPKETEQLLKQYAPQIYKRHFEREIAEAEALKKISARVMGKLSARQVFMFLTTTMDRTAVRGLWRGGFDKMVQRGATAEDAAEYATKAIRKTQPYFNVKDIPEYWRSGEFMKALTMFTNQLNQYWNYHIFDIYGKAKAGQISKSKALIKILETFIIPALVIGMISASHPPRNREDVTKSLAGMALAEVPIVGSWLSNAIRGFYGNQGVITLELLERLQNFAFQANKGEWDKVALMAPEVAGYALGIPVAQPRRTINSMVNLATGKSDDWSELIWGEYTREKARVDPYKQIEDEVWSKYPGLQKLSDKIKDLERTDPRRARELLYENPEVGSQILTARREIARLQAGLEREEAIKEREKALAGR